MEHAMDGPSKSHPYTFTEYINSYCQRLADMATTKKIEHDCFYV